MLYFIGSDLETEDGSASTNIDEILNANYGIDELYPDDMLELSEISQALNDSGVKFDLIGFDACLMGTFGYVPATLNDTEDVEIMLYWDDEQPYGYVAGYRLYQDENSIVY